ncbi:MAG: hypothetical protein DRG37_01325 [Deltaproteobacteria bacterium]|nr:MAG: hypothetical protein DRG37_01325 [Deltaproteobacteria bacterium]
MKIGIVGLGLIGSSIARAVVSREEISGVVAIDSNRSSIEAAKSEKVIDEGGVDLSLLRDSDLVILALPVKTALKVAPKVVKYLKDGSILTDTGSTKVSIVKLIQPLWPRYVGSHPIAGKERSGYVSGESSILDGTTCVITPTSSTDRSCIEVVRRFWGLCGANTVLMSPASHDAVMAVISHIPHLLSFGYMHIIERAGIPRTLIGKGLKDFTRIAASDPDVWKDIFFDNKDNIIPLINEYIKELERLRSYINVGKVDAVKELLRQYSGVRRSLDED